MNRRIDKYHCDECGEILMAVPSGAVCPNGHGRIRPHIKQMDIDAYRHGLKESRTTKPAVKAVRESL